MANALNESHCICYMNWRREATAQVEEYLFQTPLKVVSKMEEVSIRTHCCFKLRRSPLSLQYYHQSNRWQGTQLLAPFPSLNCYYGEAG